jgi:hypothetical protein
MQAELDPNDPNSEAMKHMLALAQKQNEAAAAVSQGFPAASPEGVRSAPEKLGSEVHAGDRLSPDELQTLREMIAREALHRKEDAYAIPKIEVTADDKQRFYDSVGERRPYHEVMKIIPGKLEVEFRCRTRKEVKMIENQLATDLAEGFIKSERSYATMKINYNLMIQIVKVNNVLQSNPSSKAADPKFSLRTAIDSHLINTLPEWTMFMLAGALTQFDLRCDQIAKECLDRNFPVPVAL